jgi:hypothetical protein
MQCEDLQRVTASDVLRLQSTTPKKVIEANIYLNWTIEGASLSLSAMGSSIGNVFGWQFPSRGGLSFGVGVARQIYSLVSNCPAAAPSFVRSSLSYFLITLNV